MRIAILHQYIPLNSPLDEIDTLHQVQSVQHALEQLGHKVFVFACTLDLESTVKKFKKIKAELVFNLVESLYGKDSLAIFVPKTYLSQSEQ